MMRVSVILCLLLGGLASAQVITLSSGVPEPKASWPSTLAPSWTATAPGFDVYRLSLKQDTIPFHSIRPIDTAALRRIAGQIGVTCDRFEGFTFQAADAGGKPYMAFTADEDLYLDLQKSHQVYFLGASFRTFSFVTKDGSLLGLWRVGSNQGDGGDYTYFRLDMCAP